MSAASYLIRSLPTGIALIASACLPLTADAYPVDAPFNPFVEAHVQFAESPVRHSVNGTTPGKWYVWGDAQLQTVYVGVYPPTNPGNGSIPIISLNTRDLHVDHGLYPTLGETCAPTQDVATSQAVECISYPSCGWTVRYNLSGHAYSSDCWIGYVPFTNWTSAWLPLDWQTGTKLWIRDMAHAQQNMSSEGSWAQPVVSLTPNVEPIANATPDVALNVITYPNVTFATKHAWNGTAVPQPEPQMQAASRSVLRVYRPLEHDAHSSRIVPPPLPKAPTPRGTGKPIVPLRITPSTRLAGASSPNSSGAYATLFITTGVVALAALAFVLWLLRIRASKNPLDQETRKAIHAHVVEAPGINVAGLKKKMGLSENTITYHLRRLVKEGIVAAHTEENGRAAFFPNRSEHGRFEREVLAAMRHPLKARILSYVHAEGSVLTPQLVQALGKDERIVKYHANNLIGIGLLIGRAEPGQSKRFTVNSLYVQAFERVLKDGPRTVPDFPLPPQPRGSLPEGGLGEAAYHNA